MDHYVIVAYLIGNIKYKRIFLKEYHERNEVVVEYRNLLDKYSSNKEFLCVLLGKKDSDWNILTCWALETPPDFREIAELALDKFNRGEDMYVDPNLKLENLLGSEIYNELLDLYKLTNL